MLQVSKSSKRIIIVWICFHLFALSTNYLHLNFKIIKERTESCSVARYDKASDKMQYYGIADRSHPLHIYFFYSPDCDEKTFTEFWPFVKYFVDGKSYRNHCDEPDPINSDNATGNEYFLGIFYHYDIIEFSAYSILPFLILLIKKLWK